MPFYKMQFHKIWIEQCEATHTIKEQFGLQNALDYLIGEKLLRFVAAAEEHPAFAQELPHFLRAIRGIFTPEEIDGYLDSYECRKTAEPLPVIEEDDVEEDEEESLDCLTITTSSGLGLLLGAFRGPDGLLQHRASAV